MTPVLSLAARLIKSLSAVDNQDAGHVAERRGLGIESRVVDMGRMRVACTRSCFQSRVPYGRAPCCWVGDSNSRDWNRAACCLRCPSCSVLVFLVLLFCFVLGLWCFFFFFFCF